MPETLTADTITDAQIRELRADLDHEGRAGSEYVELCDVALGGNPDLHLRSTAIAIIQTREARARCAEILNARAKAVR
jgi:hypothetical protein